MIHPVVRPLLPLLLVLFAGSVMAQQVDCTVQVNYEAVATTHKDLLTDFERDVREYVNNYAWGQEALEEKIRCTLSIFIKSATGENSYSAQVFIGSQRPIFGSEKNSAVVRLFDETWEFTYLRSRPMNHNLFQFDDLASFLDYAMLLVIGFDYDTYEPLGGTKFFRAAADVANLGRSAGAKGWDVKPGSFSRLQIVDEILSPKEEQVRRAIYQYHFTGLDSLAANPSTAYANIVGALETIGKVRRQVDSRNLYIKSFFEAKYMEIAEVFQAYPDRTVYDRLARIDPSHTTAYDEAKNRSR
jgi:hypothetical protein